ncbi:DUF4214 domain-containing protein [bacterium]|nr:DUF4214 domain-containing protein [bacterium]
MRSTQRLHLSSIPLARTATGILLVILASPTFAQPPRVNFPSGGFADLEQVIRSWYLRYFGREAEPAGIQGWVNAINRGRSLRDVQVDLLASDEFYQRQGQRPDLFVRGLYKAELGRIPTQEEMSTWIRRLRRDGDRRSKMVRDFLQWAEGQAKVAPPPIAQPTDLTRQLVDEAVLLQDAARRELTGTVQGQQLGFRTRDFIDAADQIHRAQLRRDFQPGQIANLFSNLDRSLSALEEALAWPSGTAPVTVSIARRARTHVDSLRQSLGIVETALPPRPDIGGAVDWRALDNELGTLADDVEASIRILRFPLRPTYVDAIVQREMTGLAGQVADLRNQLWNGLAPEQLRQAVMGLQNRSAGIAGNIASTSQVVPLTPQWQQVENRLAGISRVLGINAWPGTGPISTYPPTGPAPSANNLLYSIDAITADIEVFLESLTPIITQYPEAFWLQAEYRRLRANLLLLRELAARGANPAQVREQLSRVIDGYGRIQQKLNERSLRSMSVAPPNLDARIRDLQQAIR